MKLLTIGYEGLSLNEFLNLLSEQQVEILVDVRENPLSRKPGFSKTPLSLAAQSVGIEYRHLKKLGAPKPVRDQYRFDQNWDIYTKSYLAYLDQQSETMIELSSLTAQKRCCLLCFEADVNQCHRLFVAQRLARSFAPGITLTHLLAKNPDQNSIERTSLVFA